MYGWYNHQEYCGNPPNLGKHKVVLKWPRSKNEVSYNVDKFVQGLSNYFKHHSAWKKEDWNKSTDRCKETIEFAKKCNIAFDDETAVFDTLLRVDTAEEGRFEKSVEYVVDYAYDCLLQTGKLSSVATG